MDRLIELDGKSKGKIPASQLIAKTSSISLCVFALR
jgi:hypothetical protein